MICLFITSGAPNGEILSRKDRNMMAPSLCLGTMVFSNAVSHYMGIIRTKTELFMIEHGSNKMRHDLKLMIQFRVQRV